MSRGHYVLGSKSVGFSLGGVVAQAIALAIPERVGRLVIMASVAGRTAEERRTMNERAENLARGNLSGHARKAAAERWFTDEFRARHPELVEARIACSIAMDPAAYAASYRIFADNDFIDRLPSLVHRTLSATGACDPTGTERMAHLMAATIPNARAHILPRLRHSLLAEAPDQVAALLRDFLTERAAA